MEKSHFVTVIITAYNSENYIKRSISSVLDQTYTDFDLIVVNDCSTDTTASIVASEFPQVNLINKPNGGPSSSRNSGIKSATGQYVAFLDADDYWDRHKLMKQVSIIKNKDANIVCTNAMNVSNGNELGLRFDYKKVFLLDKPNYGLLVPPGIWAEQNYIKHNSTITVICDRPYESEDYITDYNLFKEFIIKLNIK